MLQVAGKSLYRCDHPGSTFASNIICTVCRSIISSKSTLEVEVIRFVHFITIFALATAVVLYIIAVAKVGSINILDSSGSSGVGLILTDEFTVPGW